MSDLTCSISENLTNQSCSAHPKNDIIYFCKSIYCEKALCFECLKDHSLIHKNNKTSQNLITISQLKKENYDKINMNLENLLSEIKSIENYYLYNYETLLKNGLNSLKQARQNTEMIVQNFFDNIEFKIQNTLMEIYEKNYPFILKNLESFKRFISHLNEHKCKLESEVNLSFLLNLNFEEIYKEYEKIKNESYSKLQKITRKNLNIKNEIFTKLTNILDEGIKFEIESDTEFIQQQDLYYCEMKQTQLNLSNKEKDELKIKSANHFESSCQHKVLHFFQDNSKILRIIDVESLYNSFSKSYHIFDIPLNISFEIPAWHKSLITPLGEIYLIGGVNTNEGNKELDMVYKFDYDELTLVKLSPMLKERYGHELCFFQNSIYILGGSNDQEGMLVFCEKYDLLENKSKRVADLKVKTFGGSSCVYQEKTIFLFGGLLEDKILNNSIQVYDIQQDVWQLVKFDFLQNNLQVLWGSSAVQINDSQILIFGGYFAENHCSRNNLIVDISADKEKNEGFQLKISMDEKYNLPYGEGFWNNQAIIQKETVFCIQNIQSEEDGYGTQLDLRRVMSFNGKKWIIYEKKI